MNFTYDELEQALFSLQSVFWFERFGFNVFSEVLKTANKIGYSLCDLLNLLLSLVTVYKKNSSPLVDDFKKSRSCLEYVLTNACISVGDLKAFDKCNIFHLADIYKISQIDILACLTRVVMFQPNNNIEETACLFKKILTMLINAHFKNDKLFLETLKDFENTNNKDKIIALLENDKNAYSLFEFLIKDEVIIAYKNLIKKYEEMK